MSKMQNVGLYYKAAKRHKLGVWRAPEELERTGMDCLLDFDPKMMEASKKKSGIVRVLEQELADQERDTCLLYTSPSPRDVEESRMPSSA